jgi:hypothetical protein
MANQAMYGLASPATLSMSTWLLSGAAELRVRSTGPCKQHVTALAASATASAGGDLYDDLLAPEVTQHHLASAAATAGDEPGLP